jgi:hypothetical protein
LGLLCGLTQSSAWKRRKVILSLIKNHNLNSVSEILDKLLTDKKTDNEPIKLIETNNKEFLIKKIYAINKTSNTFSLTFRTFQSS